MKSIAKGLIVSCQALPHEPLHSSFIMSRMAVAAKEGGAVGIRANSVEDIKAIKDTVDLPIIGIIKQDYDHCDVYITPTMKEVKALVDVGVDIIALDATVNLRPNNQTLDQLFEQIKAYAPNQKLMADCSTYEEAMHAAQLGFDFIGTTLVGYTEQSKTLKIDDNDFQLLKRIVDDCGKPVIAEGNIDTPEKAKRVLELGSYSVVVGSIITRPQLITARFNKAIKSYQEEQL